jgi:hypothetical protein
MSRASLVAAGVAVVGALVAWRFLPASAPDAHDEAADLEVVAEAQPAYAEARSA